MFAHGTASLDDEAAFHGCHCVRDWVAVSPHLLLGPVCSPNSGSGADSQTVSNTCSGTINRRYARAAIATRPGRLKAGPWRTAPSVVSVSGQWCLGKSESVSTRVNRLLREWCELESQQIVGRTHSNVRWLRSAYVRRIFPRIHAPYLIGTTSTAHHRLALHISPEQQVQHGTEAKTRNIPHYRS